MAAETEHHCSECVAASLREDVINAAVSVSHETTPAGEAAGKFLVALFDAERRNVEIASMPNMPKM